MTRWNSPSSPLKYLFSYLIVICIMAGCGGGSPTESLFSDNGSSQAGPSGTGQSSQGIPTSNSNKSSTAKDTVAPSSPRTLTQAAIFSSRVVITWSPATDNVAVTQYRVYRNATLLTTLSTTTLAYSDNSVSQDTAYTYDVTAGDAAGNWSTKKTLNVKTPLASVTGDVTLSWLKPTEREDGSPLSVSELAGYVLRYKSQLDDSYIEITISSAATDSYVIAGLNGDYDFQIAAFDNSFVTSSFVALSPK
jgi:hypothetical protein